MVGICSYLLVNFWYTRIAANQSSISALLTNRVGDCFLTIGILAVLWAFGNIDYATVFSLAPYISENIITMIGICLLIGAMAKSSQWGLHVWLPLAMEGSTYVILFTLVIAKISDLISEVINSFLLLLFFTKYLHCYFPVLTSFI